MKVQSSFTSLLFLLFLIQPAFGQINPKLAAALRESKLNPWKQSSAENLTAATWRLDSLHWDFTDGTNLEPASREYYRYDALGRRQRDSSIAWFTDLGAWRPQALLFYQYTGATAVIDRLVEVYWEQDAWSQDSFRTRNVYDNDRLTETWSDQYDAAIGEWVVIAKNVVLYDAQGVVQGHEAFLVADDGSLQPTARIAYTYNNGRLATEEGEFSFDGITWIPLFFIHHFYENNLPKQNVVELWDEETGSWEVNYRETLTYNAEDLPVIQEVEGWDGDWYPYQRATFFYSQFTTAVEDPAPALSGELTFANPFTGGTVQATALPAGQEYRLVLYDAQSRAVFEASVTGNSWQVPAPVNPGTYVLTVQQDGRVIAKRRMVTP